MQAKRGTHNAQRKMQSAKLEIVLALSIKRLAFSILLTQYPFSAINPAGTLT